MCVSQLLEQPTRSICVSHAIYLKLKQTLEGKQACLCAPKPDLVYKLIIRYKNAVKLTGSCTKLLFGLSAFGMNGRVLFYIQISTSKTTPNFDGSDDTGIKTQYAMLISDFRGEFKHLDLKGRKANETENKTTYLVRLPVFFESGHSNPWARWYGKGGPASLPILLPHSCSLLSLHQFWHLSDSQLTPWQQMNPEREKENSSFLLV